MKHTAFFISMLLFVCVTGFAQSTLRPVTPNSFHSDFLLSIYEPLFVYENTGATPVYSWLTSKVPRINWTSYGDVDFDKHYKLYAADQILSYDCDGVQFAMVAYTKGDFVLVICNLMSYSDIDEHRLYTYDFYGNVIDSLYLRHSFGAQNGHVLMPLTGALMGNLDVMTCEIRWTGDILPYHPTDRNIIGGKHEGQRIDSYYSIDETGHFVLKTCVKYYPKIYTEDDITTLDFNSKEALKRKTIFTPVSSADIEEVIDY